MLAAALLVPVACSAPAHHRHGLEITITDLPTGATAAVRVSGPGGFRTTVTASKALDVVDGRYRIAANPVRVGATTYYTQGRGVEVSAPGTVVVDYAEQVPDTTKVLPAGDAGLVPGTDPRGATLEFLPGTTGARARPGDVLVIAAGPLTAHTLFRTVVAVTPAAGRVEVAVTPAQLRDAIPRGRLRARLPIDPSASLVLKNSDGTCSAGVSGPTGDFTANAQASITGGVDFDIAWGFITPNYVKLVGEVSEQAGASLTVTAVVSCKVSKDSPGVDGPEFTIDLGPVPIVVTPELVAHAEAKGTVAVTKGYGFTESGSAKAGFTWGTPDGSNQDLHPITGAQAHFSAGPPPEDPTETMYAGAGPQVNFNLDGIDGGPYINFLGGITLTNKATSGGRYRVDVSSSSRLNVGVRLNWGPLNFSVSQPIDLASSTLYTATYGGVATTTAGPSPTATAGPPAGAGCAVDAPAPVALDLATALPGQPLSLVNAAPNQNGVLTQPPTPGQDAPGSAAECQWNGPAVTPSPPYQFPNSVSALLSIVPYSSARVAQAAWQQQAGQPVPGWPDPGVGDAARWDFPGPQDGHADLSVLRGRFVYSVAATASAPVDVVGSALRLASAIAGQLPS
ncbi:MAG: hypothetical protein EPN43_11785 [Jatrophihabitans sp.]|nr:MAG: hypothetical protein EPN43_11785 [Jatrophihabitans sp.]